MIHEQSHGGRAKRSGFAKSWCAALLSVAALAVGGSGIVLPLEEAHAIVGRPLTPVSYAGMARRTTRRTVRRTTYATAATAAYVTALPVGCTTVVVGGVTQYACGGVTYVRQLQGPNVVYVVVP